MNEKRFVEVEKEIDQDDSLVCFFIIVEDILLKKQTVNIQTK